MPRHAKEPLRVLSEPERKHLEKLSRSRSASAAIVARAKELLAVADHCSFTAAARKAGRRSEDAVCRLVRRFNQEGLQAVLGHHGGGAPAKYTPLDREKILEELQRQPDREIDGTATWSLKTLQRSLRSKGMEQISTYTVWKVLRDSGHHWQRSRSWCKTGKVLRRRKAGVIEVEDPDTDAKRR